MRTYLVFLVVFGFFLIYLAGVSKTVFGGDSGDIILAYYFAGIPHPPGYPLNTMLGVFLANVLPGPTFAYKANLIAAIYHSLVVGFLFLLISKLTKNMVLGLAASATLAFVPLFWLYGHVAEVFQLTSIFTVASLLCLFDFWQFGTRENRLRSLYFSIFFLGLAIFHHQTTALLLPAYFYALRKMKILHFKNLKLLGRLAGALMLGIVPYFYVFWSAARKTPINWNDPVNFQGFWQLITRADYGTFTASQDLVGISAIGRLIQFWWYFKVALADFTFLGLFLALIGLVWLFIKNRDRLWFWFLAWFFSGPFFLAYASFPPFGSALQGISERFFLLNYLFLTILLSFGMLAIVKTVSGSNFWKNRKPLVELLLSAGFLLLPLAFFSVNWAKADLSSNRLGEVLGLDILNAAEGGGMIFLQGDTITFNTQYSYYVDGVGEQSILIMTGRVKHKSYRDQLANYYPQVVFPENFSDKKKLEYRDSIVPLLERNYSKFPIYSTDNIQIPADYIWLPQGMLFRLYKKSEITDDTEIAQKILVSLEKLKFNKELLENRYLHFFDENIKDIYTRVFINNAFGLLRRDYIFQAQKYFGLVVELKAENMEAQYGLGITYFQGKECKRSEKIFSSIVEKDSSYWQAWEGLGHVYNECFGDEEKAELFLQRSVQEKKKQFDKSVEELR